MTHDLSSTTRRAVHAVQQWFVKATQLVDVGAEATLATEKGSGQWHDALLFCEASWRWRLPAVCCWWAWAR